MWNYIKLANKKFTTKLNGGTIMYYEQARNFIYKNARPLDIARWKSDLIIRNIQYIKAIGS